MNIEQQLVEALVAAQKHLEWCGYGDRYERECAMESKLPEQIQAALDAAKLKAERNKGRPRKQPTMNTFIRLAANSLGG